MDKKQLSFLIIFNFILAVGFYFDNLNALYTDISSDSANIIPICMKLDNNADLYKNDLYLNNIKDVEYYTPFYVESLRFFAKFTDGNYLQAQNILGSCLHFIHGILWFLLFYTIRKDYWMALFMMLFAKGIIWPPGAEVIGITELWTIMPRTVYAALLPLPFLAFVYLKKYKLPISGFILGFILNFHPLSGIGGIIGYVALYFGYLYFNQKLNRSSIRDFFVIVVFCLIGMFPYLVTYLTNVKGDIIINQATYELAFNSRIPKIFSNPIEFIKRWHRPVFYFYLLSFVAFYFFDSSQRKKIFKILLFTALTIFLTANLSVYIERMINDIFSISLKMSFQLIRFQKYIIFVFQISLFLLLVELISKYKINQTQKAVFFGMFYLLLMFADVAPLNKLPLIGDDICNTTLPMSLKFREKVIPQDTKDFNQMLDYIKENTPENSVFYGSYYIRYASSRSVILDEKGAGMLIEGNSEKFVSWYNERKMFSDLDEPNKVEFLRSKKGNYILDNKQWNTLIPQKIIGKYYLYKI